MNKLIVIAALLGCSAAVVLTTISPSSFDAALIIGAVVSAIVGIGSGQIVRKLKNG